ncbi:hypothetical protein H4Q26_002137 [Puccinia striiformis f. sp. tritici PST-130]|nr:hypothetical protein H4Q26_002137 [Puccinia striiformis f. sp. tritici PST-130]
MAIDKNDQVTTKLEDLVVPAATIPVNYGSAQPPTDDTQDPSELGELHLRNESDCDARSDLGIDVDPANYNESCSHSNSASITSPDLELVPSAGDCREPTHFSDALQPVDNPDYSNCLDRHFEHARDNGNYNDTPENHLHTNPDIYTSDHASNFEGQHSDHDPGEDQYADGGHYDAGDVYDDHGADLDPGDDYHDDYHDDYYEDDYYDDGVTSTTMTMITKFPPVFVLKPCPSSSHHSPDQSIRTPLLDFIFLFSLCSPRASCVAFAIITSSSVTCTLCYL